LFWERVVSERVREVLALPLDLGLYLTVQFSLWSPGEGSVVRRSNMRNWFVLALDPSDYSLAEPVEFAVEAALSVVFVVELLLQSNFVLVKLVSEMRKHLLVLPVVRREILLRVERLCVRGE
jgi:hypothetical protein